MGLIASDTGGGNFELTPSGNHLAICYMVVDLGVQESHFGSKRKVRIAWELPHEQMEDGRPFSVSKSYTLSLNEKANLRRDLESWRGRAFTADELQGFDLFTIIGKPCFVNVIHETSQDGTRTYANVASVAAVPKGTDVPALTNEAVTFSLEDDDASQKLSQLPDWLQEKINTRGLEQNGSTDQPPVEAYADDLNDDVPFNQEDA